MSGTHNKAAHGGQSAETRRAFTSGIVSATLADIPWDCECEWTTRGRIPNVHWALKFTSGRCNIAAHAAKHREG